MEVASAFEGHKIGGTERKPFDPFLSNPEKSSSIRAKQPLVTAANGHRCAQVANAEFHCAGALSDIEQKGRADFFARASESCGVEHGAIIEANEAGRDDARLWADRGDVVIGADETAARLDDAYLQFAGCLVAQPSGKMRGKFAASDEDFVAWLPIDTGGDAGHT